VHRSCDDQRRSLDLLDRVHVLLHERLDQRFVKAMRRREDNVERRFFDIQAARLGEL
jgi:hypothetical protein